MADTQARERGPTLGMELELWVVDDQGRLCDGTDLAAHEGVEAEFVDSLVEVKTDPHETETALRRDLQERLASAIESAAANDRRLVPLGTPLTPTDGAAAGERGELFERIYGDSLQGAKNCAGTHIHFQKNEVERQLNLLTALDPALALVSSSPYYLGERERTSSRAAAYRRACGEQFERFSELWAYAESVDEWAARVDAAYDTFLDLAAERGVDPERVGEAFQPEDTVLNPVRLRQEQPTVEWRAPDTALPSQAVSLAVDVRRLVAETDEKPIVQTEDLTECGVDADAIRVPTFEELTELSEAAIAEGLESERVCRYLDAFGFDRSTYEPIAGVLACPPSLDDHRARRLRLNYATHLRTDVDSLAA